jgi:hypothetical protein
LAAGTARSSSVASNANVALKLGHVVVLAVLVARRELPCDVELVERRSAEGVDPMLREPAERCRPPS